MAAFAKHETWEKFCEEREGGLYGQQEVKRRVKLGAGQPDRGIVKYHVKGGEGELSGGGGESWGERNLIFKKNIIIQFI